MTLTPSTVRETTFRVVRRGYDTGEVDAFLAEVQAELRRRDAAAGGATGAAPGPGSATAADRPPAASDQADLAVDVLRLAQQTAQQLLADAREQARSLQAAATAEADRLRGEAQRQRRDDVARLERRRDELQAEVQSLLGLRTAHRAELIDLLQQQLRQAQGEGDGEGEGLHVVRSVGAEVGEAEVGEAEVGEAEVGEAEVGEADDREVARPGAPGRVA